jgi:hypothetical protein
MSQPLTDWLRESRFTVVHVRRDLGQIRVKNEADACTDLACSGHVVDDEGAVQGLEALNPGDIIKVEREAGRPERIVVVRRAWDELTSPEF